MSDLTATTCGCNDTCGCANSRNNNFGCGLGGNSCLWIILLLFFCNGNGGRSGCNSGCDNWLNIFNNKGCGCCEIIICLLLLFTCCGGNGC